VKEPPPISKDLPSVFGASIVLIIYFGLHGKAVKPKKPGNV
jgi:hypothetical protein